MRVCKKCKKKLGLFDKIFCDGFCSSCKSNEIDKKRKDEKIKAKIRETESKKINKVEEKLKKFEILEGFLNYGNLEGSFRIGEFYEESGNDDGINHKKDKNGKYNISPRELFERIIKNNFDAEKTLKEIEEEIEYKLQIDKFKEKERKRKIRENAEKDFYGRVKSKRDNLSLDKREDILRKFNNECVVCGKKEGLHIHHKDGNPKNNQIGNLVVLCGVCHKKAHMKVR